MTLVAMGKAARDAAYELAVTATRQKNQALLVMADELEINAQEILAANALDIEAARNAGLSEAMLDPNNIPRHVAIIMDGNGRWAKQRGLPRTAGHKKGAAVFQDIANYCEELGVSSVTFYAFSTENWKRPLEEVSAIMKLFGEYLLKGFNYKDRNIRIKFLGDRAALDAKLQKLMNELEEDSAAKTGMTLNIAVNYGGRPEIVRAARQLAQQVAEGTLKPEDITEEMMSDHMYTAGQKDPDFILRPSGEKRLSNFMLWQAAYAELVEMDVLWPDFTRDDLDAAITEFNKRSRRFGGI